MNDKCKTPDNEFLEQNTSLLVSILRLSNILRSLGLRISTSEMIDAFCALKDTLLVDKQEFKYCLKCTLLKEKDKEEIFEQAFEEFFQPPENKEQSKQERQAKKEEIESQIEEVEEKLQFKGESLDLEDHQKLTYANMDDDQKEYIKKVLEDTEEGKKVDENFRPIIENMVKSALNRWEERLSDRLPTYMPQDTGDEELDMMKEKINLDGGGEGGFSSAKINEKDLKDLSEKDLPRARKIMQALIKKLMNNISRRYRSTNKKAQLEMRKTIRKNISHGGTLINLKYKEKRRTKPSLLVICDVSGSMARYTSFLLQFIYGLGSAIKKTEGFIFSEDLERITNWTKGKNDFEKSMAELVNKSEEWGKATDLANSLKTLEEKWEYILKPNTTVIILSDGISSNIKLAEEEVKKLKRKVKEIIWINPIPAENWNEISQIEKFQEHVKMHECNTLNDLEKVLKEEIFSIR